MWRWILWGCFPIYCHAQNEWPGLVQPSGSLHYQLVVLAPLAFIHTNAGLAFTDSGAIGISAENRYSIRGLSTAHAALKLKTNNGGWGVFGSAFGNEVMNGITGGLGYGIRLSKSFGIGTGIRLNRDQIRGYAPLMSANPQVGFLYFIDQKFCFGFHVHKSITASYIKEQAYKQIDRIITGIGYKIDERVYTSIEIVNEFRLPAWSKIYAEWTASKRIKAFLLYKTISNELQLGFHGQFQRVSLSAGISNHSFLGNSSYIMFYRVF